MANVKDIPVTGTTGSKATGSATTEPKAKKPKALKPEKDKSLETRCV